jgi:hypothetical protein
MNTNDADTVMEILSGYWPTPDLTDEEVRAWYSELCGYLKITAEEAGKVIATWARSGETFRLRPGQIVAEVQALRRRRALERPALMASPQYRDDHDQVWDEWTAHWREVCQQSKEHLNAVRRQRLVKN